MFQKRFVLILGVTLLLPAAALAQPPALGFATRMGSTGNDSGRSVAVDFLGNVYTMGFFTGTVDFDPGAGTSTLTSTGLGDTFVTKYDSWGNLIWARRFGGTVAVGASDIAVDAGGDVYITGYFTGTADFDPGAGTFNLTSSGDIFVSKLDPSGNLVWVRQIGGVSTDFAYALVVDDTSNVYLTGSFNQTVDFDPGALTVNLTSVGGNDDVFVLKLNASGSFVWVRQFGGTSTPQGFDIAVDNSGNVHTVGVLTGTVDFDPGPGIFNLTNVGATDGFVSKLDSAGNFLWAGQFSGITNEPARSVAVDSSGNILVTGEFSLTTDFDPGAGTFNMTSLSSQDIYIVKLDASGNFVWAKQLGGTGGNANGGVSITTDESDNVYTTGYFSGTGDFDPGTGTFNLAGAFFDDIFVSKLDASGDFVWAWGTGGTSLDAGASIAVSGEDNVYVTGLFEGTADFDPGAATLNLTSGGQVDGFAVKLGPGPSVPAATAKVILSTALLFFVCVGFALRRSRKQVVS